VAQPSDALRNLVFFTLDHGVDSVSDGGPLIPFMVVQRPGGRELRRFVSETLEGGQAAMREAVAELDDDATAYAMAYDGYFTHEGKKWDAVLVEAAERGASSGVVYIQRYEPKKGLFGKFKTVGNAAFLQGQEGQALGGRAG
jgi:hypothetical protein